MEITSTKQLIDLVFAGSGPGGVYTPEENAAIGTWLGTMRERKEALRSAVATSTPAYGLTEVTVNDGTTMYKPVTRYQVVPSGQRSYIGWVEATGDGWRGFAYDSYPRGTVHTEQAQAVIDAFTDYLSSRTDYLSSRLA